METVEVPKKDYDDLIKTLEWIKDNPGIHPNNIRQVILALHKIFVVN